MVILVLMLMLKVIGRMIKAFGRDLVVAQLKREEMAFHQRQGLSRHTEPTHKTYHKVKRDGGKTNKIGISSSKCLTCKF